MATAILSITRLAAVINFHTEFILLISPILSQAEAVMAQQSLTTSLDSRRLFHGRGRCYPGLESVVLDYYQPVLLLSLFAEMGDAWEQELLRSLRPLLEQYHLQGVMVARRYQRGAAGQWLWRSESLDDDFFARRGSLKFTIKLGERQNTGYFLDMEPGRQWLEGIAAGRKVLNLFSYTCAFTVVAAAAGASEVVNVDMARGALKQGQLNQQLNADVAGVTGCKMRFLAENILKSWSRIRRPGPYDVIVIDPPSFQKGSFVARDDYKKVLRRIPQLANPGADILICLNAPELGEDFIRDAIAEVCPACEFQQRLKPSADFPDINPEQQLKLFHYRFEGETEQVQR